MQAVLPGRGVGRAADEDRPDYQTQNQIHDGVLSQHPQQAALAATALEHLHKLHKYLLE